jgi:V/A-type H+-transporting ATPase subunit I
VLTQGRSKPTIVGKLVGGLASLYNITSYFGDILSYSRIMALMLAGGIIASIVNVLGSLQGSIFVFIIVFLIGHSFNIGINIIGTYVHAARLLYLEFSANSMWRWLNPSAAGNKNKILRYNQ